MALRLHFDMVWGIDDLQTHEYEIIDPRYNPRRDWWNLDVPLPIDPNLTENYEASKRVAEHDVNTQLLRIWLNSYERDIHQMLYHHIEYGVSNIIGVYANESCDTIYNHPVLYGLLSTDPRYAENGYQIIPQQSIRGDDSWIGRYINIYHAANPAQRHQYKRLLVKSRAWKKYRRPIRLKQKMISRGWNYQYWPVEFIQSYVMQARYLFDWIGLHVQQRSMKLMLVWKWS